MNEDQTNIPDQIDTMPSDAAEVSVVAAMLGVAPRLILRAADAGRIRKWVIEQPGRSRLAAPTLKTNVSMQEVRDWFDREPEARKAPNKSHQYHVVYWVQTDPQSNTQDLDGFIRANSEATLVKREYIVQLRESDAKEIEQMGAKHFERAYGVRGFNFRRLGT